MAERTETVALTSKTNVSSKSEKETEMLQKVLGDFKQFLFSDGSHMTCTICKELFSFSNTINCGHTFCEFCINTWKESKNECPMCRAKIKSQVPNKSLDRYIEEAIQNFMDEEFKDQRKRHLEDRKDKMRAKLRRLNNVIVSITPNEEPIPWFIATEGESDGEFEARSGPGLNSREHSDSEVVEEREL